MASKPKTITLTLVGVVAAVLVLVMAPSIASNKALAAITTECDGEPGECPGNSSNPGQGHDEERVNPTGKALPRQNKG
jgi:hypothetical protein